MTRYKKILAGAAIVLTATLTSEYAFAQVPVPANQCFDFFLHDNGGTKLGYYCSGSELKVATLSPNDAISSLATGNNMRVLVFEHSNFDLQGRTGGIMKVKDRNENERGVLKKERLEK